MAFRSDRDLHMQTGANSSSSSSNSTYDSPQSSRGRQTEANPPAAPRKRQRSASPPTESSKHIKTEPGGSRETAIDLDDLLDDGGDDATAIANSLVNLSDSESKTKSRVSNGATAPGGARVGVLLTDSKEGKRMLDALYTRFHNNRPFICGLPGFECTHYRRWYQCTICNWGRQTCLASVQVSMDIVNLEANGGVELSPPCYECGTGLLEALQHFFGTFWTLDNGTVVLQTMWPLIEIVWSFIDFEPEWDERNSCFTLLNSIGC